MQHSKFFTCSALFALLCACGAGPRSEHFDDFVIAGETLESRTGRVQPIFREAPGPSLELAKIPELDDEVFHRLDFPSCAHESKQTPFAVDEYETMHTSQALSCATDPVVEPLPDVEVSRAFDSAEACYGSFAADIASQPPKAIAAWIFWLTQARHGSLGSPEQLTIRRMDFGTDPYTRGHCNRGIFVVQSKEWASPMAVKLYCSGDDVRHFARILALPPTRQECPRALLTSDRPDISPDEWRFMPDFIRPLAMSLYGSQPTAARRNDDAPPLDRGLAIMPLATGRQEGPIGSNVAPPIDLAQAEQSAALQGRALALMHFPYLKSDGTPAFEQRSWTHGDLHYGNVFADPGIEKVFYIDFEKMGKWFGWVGEAKRAFGHVRPRPETGQLLARLPGGPPAQSLCSERLAALVGTEQFGQEVAAVDPGWVMDRVRLLAFWRGYLRYAPDFALADLNRVFEQVCARGEAGEDRSSQSAAVVGGPEAGRECSPNPG